MEASNLLSGTINGSFNFTTEDVHGYNLTNNDTLMVNGSENTTNPLCELNAYCEPVEDYVDRLYEEIYPDTGKWILIAVYIITFIVGLMGNVLVCFAIWRNPNMRTVTNIYIVNLSLADLAVIIVCLPSVLLQDVTLTWFFGTFFCKISLFLMNLSAFVSVLTLTAISIERWYAICDPLRFHSTLRRARIALIFIWLVAAVLATPDLIFGAAVPHFPYTVIYTACYPAQFITYEGVMINQMFICVFLYLIPLLIMGFVYSHIAYVLCFGNIPGESRSRQPMLNHQRSEIGDQTESRRKAAKMLFAIVFMFAVCFFPNHLINVLRYAHMLDQIEHIQIIALVAHWLVCLNSCINPVIYNFMSDKFRKEFRKSVTLCLRCKCSRRHRTFRQNDTYRVTFTSNPTLSCHMTDHRSTFKKGNPDSTNSSSSLSRP